MRRITRRVLALPVVAVVGAVAAITLSVSPASAATVPPKHNSCCSNYGHGSTYNEYAKKETSRNCPPPKHPTPPPPKHASTPPVKPTKPNTGGHTGAGGGQPITSITPTRPGSHPTTKTPTKTPTKSPPRPHHSATSAPAPASAPAAANVIATPPAPVLNTAPESDSVSLVASPTESSISPVTAALSHASGDASAPASASPVAPQEAAPAGNTSPLGLSDNLLLASLVAVFALAVVALVSAGGHRGSWRRH
jgi:hypothetical protein